METTFTRPPLIPTTLHPDDIIGQEMSSAFRDHYIKTHKCQSAEDFQKSIRNIPENVRLVIGRIYDELIAHGYRPVGVDASGKIIWSVVTDLHHSRFRRLDKEPTTKRERNEYAEKYLRKLRGYSGAELSDVLGAKSRQW